MSTEKLQNYERKLILWADASCTYDSCAVGVGTCPSTWKLTADLTFWLKSAFESNDMQPRILGANARMGSTVMISPDHDTTSRDIPKAAVESHRALHELVPVGRESLSALLQRKPSTTDRSVRLKWTIDRTSVVVRFANIVLLKICKSRRTASEYHNSLLPSSRQKESSVHRMMKITQSSNTHWLFLLLIPLCNDPHPSLLGLSNKSNNKRRPESGRVLGYDRLPLTISTTQWNDGKFISNKRKVELGFLEHWTAQDSRRSHQKVNEARTRRHV